LPNFNVNIIDLIPKTNKADTVEQFRPIAIANFKFKVISKILANRLSTIMLAISSIQQRGFIKGRIIKDCICLTSEVINVLHKKTFGGNLALKVDMAKAFDTINWIFLLKVLKTFGFNDLFCSWIKTILESAKMSIAINGKLHGYFSCSRGVRQGDPLSPLLFCLAEEVLSRSLTKLVKEGKLKLIQGSRNNPAPSHILYVDDIMVFCKGSASNIQNLIDIFLRYAQASGQHVNPQKSSIFSGSISHQRLSQISNLTDFSIGSLPFTYLGVPIFKGKAKTTYFQPIADKVKLKLSASKASLLSLAGRVQLVKSVIHSMLLHCISIYSWPVQLIKDLERWMRNFIWSGDVNKRKLVIVAWHKVCTPFKEGGLGIRSLSKVNEGANLKLCWEMTQSNLPWALFFRNRVLKHKTPVNYHIISSVWSSIKHKYNEITSNSSWLLGNGNDISFWLDPWSGEPLVKILNIPTSLHPSLKAIVNLFINNKSWSIPENLIQMFPSLQGIIKPVSIPAIERDDQFIWSHSHDGNLSFKEAYQHHCHIGQNMSWANSIWNIAIPPSKSFMVWRSLHNKLPTDENLILRGCQFPSMCSLCSVNIETTTHFLMECYFARTLWNWVESIINLQCNFSSIQEAIQIGNINWSPLCNVVIQAAVINIINTIWFCRNQQRFNNKKINVRSTINLIISGTSLAGNISKCAANTTIADFVLLKAFSVKINYGKAPTIKEVLWQPPVFNWIKRNVDGASVGNPGPSSCGGIFKDSNGDFLGAFAYNLLFVKIKVCGLCSSLEQNHFSSLLFIIFKVPANRTTITTTTMLQLQNSKTILC